MTHSTRYAEYEFLSPDAKAIAAALHEAFMARAGGWISTDDPATGAEDEIAAGVERFFAAVVLAERMAPDPAKAVDLRNLLEGMHCSYPMWIETIWDAVREVADNLPAPFPEDDPFYGDFGVRRSIGGGLKVATEMCIIFMFYLDNDKGG